ncbi:MAG: hypothetical protein QOI31_2828 [Solirubrobacterales bacterium]|jgi:hypothetical protein|nr:hypothetical protein [Solirubrobacterales bacterium]
MAFRLPQKRLIAAFAAVAFVIVPSAIASGASITLEASKTELKPNQTTDLSGTLSDTLSSTSGKTITLYATPYPYETEEVAGTTTTTQGGTFSFQDVDPAINTRYRVAFDGDVLDGDATSGNVQIYRFIRDDYDLDVTRDGYAEARIDLLYPPEVQPEYYVGRKDVFWYFGKTTQNRYKRVDRTRFFDTSAGVASDVRFRLPRSRKAYRFFFFPCVEAPAEDIGLGNEEPVTCPGSIKARSARSAARSAYAA